jgi:toxin ParE1/3/4
MASGRWEIRLAEAAEKDFQSILVWTAEQFGETQAHRYRGVLVAALTALADGPTPLNWKPRDDIAPGLRVLHVARRGRPGRHILLYRARGDRLIEIVRILHDAMDLERHLPPRTNRSLGSQSAPSPHRGAHPSAAAK